MSQPVLSVSEVRELMEAFRQSGLGSLELRQGDFSLALEGPKMEQVPAVQQTTSYVAVSQTVPCLEEEPQAPCGNLVSSPIVGTFYAAPAPEKPVFVQVGQQVKKGDVLFIIESMKLMNEVQSDFDGVVAEIYVQDAQPVEYGQPILRIQ